MQCHDITSMSWSWKWYTFEIIRMIVFVTTRITRQFSIHLLYFPIYAKIIDGNFLYPPGCQHRCKCPCPYTSQKNHYPRINCLKYCKVVRKLAVWIYTITPFYLDPPAKWILYRFNIISASLFISFWECLKCYRYWTFVNCISCQSCFGPKH